MSSGSGTQENRLPTEGTVAAWNARIPADGIAHV